MSAGRCEKCGAETGGAVCRNCAGNATQTIATPASRPATVSAAMDEGRFPPGAMIGQRYRVVSLLGRGGMGEVYRANDLLVGQTVALKFLPEAWTREEAHLSRLRNEVRVARMVSHPNVCRVHDLGEAEGRLFLSMEFVDGEDLGSLLRRIGKLPEEKATEIAHMLCAGLAAAHGQGVIHRDLKPANIMIDGRGEVRITDFGLAGIAGEIRDIGSGTPAYMPPEQRSGKEVTALGDIYSLGMVLREVFTGKGPGESSTSGLPAKVAPVVERCLEEDPGKRPASALAVARALPGGDPLAAALAMGQTPSPELVAASGERAAMPVKWAVAALLVAMAGPVMLAWRSDRRAYDRWLPVEELTARARTLARKMGGSTGRTYETSGFSLDREYAGVFNDADPARLRQALWLQTQFWFRSSGLPLGGRRSVPGATISPGSPPLALPGEQLIVFDIQGRLKRYETVVDLRSPAGSGPQWEEFFALASLPKDELREVARGSDGVSWEYRDKAGVTYRVEGEVTNGHVRRFALSGAWNEPAIPSAAGWMFVEALWVMAFLFAWRNWKLGRIDAWGGAVVAAAILVTRGVSELLNGHDLLHWSLNVSPMDTLMGALPLAVMMAAGYWGMEPFLRRHWPQVLVTWTRLLQGQWKDPTVARDVLLGGAFFSVTGLIFFAFTLDSLPPVDTDMRAMEGPRQFIGTLLVSFGVALTRAVGSAFLMFLVKLGLRNDRAAILGFSAFLVLMQCGPSANWYWAPVTQWILVGTVFGYSILRFGLLLVIANYWAASFLISVPMTLDPGHWFSGYSFAALGVVWAVQLVAFRLSLGGQRLLSDDV